MHVHGTPDGSEDSLKALIKARQQSREEKLGGFFDTLEEKYCKKPKASGSKSGSGSRSQKAAKKASSDSRGTSSKSSKIKSTRQTKE